MKKWQILNNSTVQQFSNDSIIKILLANRGLKKSKEIKEFLNPLNPQDIKPETLNIETKEMKAAVNRIKKAIVEQQSIVVYGDYDADGVCSTAVLWETLHGLAAKAMPYIPHRINEGYGLSKKGIDNVKKEFDAKLIITVDHGVNAFEKVEYAKKLGIDVIICDHHLKPKKLPKALAIIHTVQLCGAGVTWMLVQELIRHSGERSDSRIKNGFWTSQNDAYTLDLVAIATIADMVPLIGPNRSFVKHGLEELNITKRYGLKALMNEAGLKKGRIGVYDISFILAPRLNAMGRMEHAMDSLRLLCTKDENKAIELARLLNDTNRERQKLTEETLLHADNEYKRLTVTGQKLIFLSHESYNQGIIGLVAGKLTEKYYLPSVIISRGLEFSKASARSISGFNIIENLRKLEELLVDCGGHPMAAGFTIETKNLEIFQQRLTEIVDQEIDESKLTKVLKIDCELELSDLSLQLYNKIQEFAPFGLGNSEPVFCSREVFVEEARMIGNDNKHLKLKISQRNYNAMALKCQFTAVAFGMGEMLSKLSSAKPVEIVYSLNLNEWNGDKNLELKIKDIKIS